jgi:hypothetical protein
VKRFCHSAIVVFAAALLAASESFAPSAEVNRALACISPDSLRGNLSFLASDLLEGRDTPSRGLDLAAEYIAAQLRRAGLEPAGDDGYYQTARMFRAEAPAGDFALRLSKGSIDETPGKDEVAVVSRKPLNVSAAVYKIEDFSDVQAHAIPGKAVELDVRSDDVASVAQQIAALKPSVFLQIEEEQSGPTLRQLIDPDEERAVFGGIPRVILRARGRHLGAIRLLKDAHRGETGIKLSLRTGAAALAPVTVRNVAGLLRGSGPLLAYQYVVLSAHYDHIGRRGHRIFPGANDDASGAVSVIEIGRVLAALSVRPQRSILFLTFFGEEKGSLGAHYYTRHPLVPLDQTIADLNLEQLGRTDSNMGTEIGNASLTGFDYSDIARTLQRAGQLTGVRIYKTPNDEQYFSRSDNYVFADEGIPAHTIAVTFNFPDYHDSGDVWQKIDYDNLARVDRAIALGTLMLAESPAVPRWNPANPEAARYERSRTAAGH